MKKFKVGDVVKHDYYSEQQGTVTEVRDEEPYTTYVKWDSSPERNDWFKPEVLVLFRGSSGGALALGDLNVNAPK